MSIQNSFDDSALDIERLRRCIIESSELPENIIIVPKNQLALPRDASRLYTFSRNVPDQFVYQFVSEIHHFRSDRTKLPPAPEALSRNICIAIDIANNIANNTKLSPIGDTTCRNNANSPHLRCAVNPDPEAGTCEGCPDYESALE